MSKRFEPLWVFALSVAMCFGQAPTDSGAAYEAVQKRRVDAERLWRERDRRGTDILRQILADLETPLIRDLAQGNPYLLARAPNVHYDLAIAYVLRGENERALTELEEVLRSGGFGTYKTSIEKEPAFEAIRSTLRYQNVMARLSAESRLWSDGVFGSGFKPALSLEERVAGLSRFWAEVKFAFPYFNRRPEIDWDSLYLEYLTKVMQARSTFEYYQMLQRFCALLRDGHTNVYFPKELMETEFVKPPVRTGLIGGKVLILEVPSAALRSQGLRVGDEIVAVDGVPVRAYARDGITPFQSSSTPQDLDVRTYTYSLLRGPARQPVQLTLEAANGAQKLVVARTGYTDVEQSPRLEARVLPGNIGYLAVNDFNDSTIVDLFDASWATISNTRALIIDVRRNGGGSSSYGWRILGCLTEKPFRISRMKARQYNPFFRAQGFQTQWYTLPNEQWKPDGKRLYKNSVALLSSAATFSAAEDFLVAFRAMSRGIIVGERSGGSTGQPLFFALPGGGSARVCTKWDSYPDGSEFVGSGVNPDREVRPTVEGLRSGRDEILEAATRELSPK